MTENHSTKGHSPKEHPQRRGGTPLVVTSAVAACLSSRLITRFYLRSARPVVPGFRCRGRGGGRPRGSGALFRDGGYRITAQSVRHDSRAMVKSGSGKAKRLRRFPLASMVKLVLTSLYTRAGVLRAVLGVGVPLGSQI
jgi:hypothetical protein